ncbi:transferase [Desulfospira joergensenii]|uniref:transferase n=1 Tax=Desulfospira joergensenii TaxID=53329 RepID=UPI0003B6E138|nr:transferase [Desulfospira joergensenii]
MKNLKLLNDRIISRVNANLKEFEYDTSRFIRGTIEYEKLAKFYCFYGITSFHPIDFNFRNASMAGSYFLGKCSVNQSIIYKSDIRGDELKREGEIMDHTNPLPLVDDETIVINGSLLYKTLVHNNSHNPETPEEFTIRNTVSAHYANIHGATTEGCFLGAFSTVDLMNLHSCIIGEFSYIQAGDFYHEKIDPGVIHIESEDFIFLYKYEKEVIDKYIGVNESFQPRGLIYDFVREKEPVYERLFKVVDLPPIDAPESSAVNRYAVIKGQTRIGENVLISQRAYLDNAHMGNGSNAQENSFIINSHLVGMNVTAHGGKIINARIGQKTFVGFNSFLHGKEDAKLAIGKKCIVMPHTIIDIEEPLTIPDKCLVWGYITCEKDLKTNTLPIEFFSEFDGDYSSGSMRFAGDGKTFVEGFSNRIEHILEANGAYCDYDHELRGHAQEGQQISFNTLQPYPTGEKEGLYPSIRIQP